MTDRINLRFPNAGEAGIKQVLRRRELGRACFDVGANSVALGGLGKRGQARAYSGSHDFWAQNVII